MLETLSKGFRAARLRLQNAAEITEDGIRDAVRDIRVSLLEADVEYGVVNQFVAAVTEKAVGEVVKTKVRKKDGFLAATPADHFVRICHDELVSLMGPVDAGVDLSRKGVTTIMMVGLQGSGKTTTAGKLARMVKSKHGKKPMLVAADIYRPAAVQQLLVLGRKLGVPVFHLPDMSPPELCRKALDQAHAVGRDVVIFDTAGRLAIDEPLMKELEEIKRLTQPSNVFFVCDAMIGQDAVRTAAEFDRRLDFTGFILTKLDGDARGGAALSIKQVTGKPIKYLGMGEGLDKLEEFRPEGLASRILGMGDIVGLMQDFQQHVDEEKAERSAQKLLKGQFNFDDFLDQIRTIQKMGTLQEVFEKLPFAGEMLPPGVQLDDRELVRVEAAINSMTSDERRNPDVLNESRFRRIARGSGQTVQQVKDLYDRFRMARKMMGEIGKVSGLLSRVGSLGKLAKMGRQLKGSGLDIDPSALALGSGAGIPGMDGGERKVKPLDRKKVKAKRKQERDARKKARAKNK
ncbi:signal recognition particle protein [Myxococcota bacterium]|nr:signal recognition particle protein [Myxococcota bacterium]